MTAQELASWIALHAVPGMGAASLARLLARFGTPGAVLDAPPKELLAVPKVPALVLRGVLEQAGQRTHHEAIARRLLAEGVSAVRRDEPEYPLRLHNLSSPPPLLYVRGRLPRDSMRTFGIVGTTEPSHHGAEIARAIAAHLAARGWAIVSGAARGIDAAAHRAAFAARKPTILVLPTGILRVRSHARQPEGEAVWGRAAAVSECHPEAPWCTAAALARNRLIAALSDAVLVVEARERGGSIGTLRHALALGRRGFVVRFRAPALSAAANAVAEAMGATPVRSIRELDEALAQPPRLGAQSTLVW
ncbi:MAG TPA: DNA-processing protein DprA [Planctomycetota bacterium]|nr:DNA-processing protein DprA [Planctomycetota bacterium]HRR81640.1 DNA-processing protein DprA [Planctomycetota bacterium]HRT93690.1 DNA-processing protein DprA [Planctomycetota bacterium]